MMRTRALALGLLLPLLLAAAPGKPRPSLLVIVAVDGLSWDRLHAWRGAFDGGFATLLREGHVAAGAHYAHLNTETCPGHAALSTGAPPRITSAPYDLAPTLADYAGVTLPSATGRSLRAQIERSAGRTCR